MDSEEHAKHSLSSKELPSESADPAIELVKPDMNKKKLQSGSLNENLKIIDAF